MSIANAKKYLEERGFDVSRVIETEESSATVELAAAALGCEAAMIAKSLTFDVRGESVLIVAAGDVRVDNPKFKACFGTKAKMLSRDEVGERIGHDVGGVCPFGVKENVKVYLDESLKRFEYVYPACGNASSAVKLSLSELEELSQSKGWVDIAK